MQRAARLRGLTLTGYLIATAGEDARRTVEEADVLRLAAEDQVRFAKALIDPPAPNARLARAAKRHADLIAPIARLTASKTPPTMPGRAAGTNTRRMVSDEIGRAHV